MDRKRKTILVFLTAQVVAWFGYYLCGLPWERSPSLMGCFATGLVFGIAFSLWTGDFSSK